MNITRPIIGESKPMKKVFRALGVVAPSLSSVLITGESGTGKELIARALHELSPRAAGPFVPINCGAIPETLLESELFGHVKGAFTGAHQARLGRFALADGGTLFLDEIGEMSPMLQVKLLRVLQERVFEPVGGTQSVEVDVRVVAATNQSLEQAIEEKRFRSDLYYRLNVVEISLPPLRQREGDVDLLLHHFNIRLYARRGRRVSGFGQGALEALRRYPWPGNVRELENVVERLSVFCADEWVEREDLPEKILEMESPSEGGLLDLPEEGLDLRETLARLEDHLILQALERTHWNKNRASQLLRMNRTTLVEKLKKKGITSQT
ncbi:sigma-54 dependent transcriptional regulator [Myxococcota bacterium]|nr:sigma-54 dependent transcriptional regulator [Myxococcota bacterium]MBU1429656.1 sigma-54 dependent transcriptional regulator [Myxococcota bacterium]MBU1898117.1 sigma-54 dependent transcriptional regulator [Myxococcota bacterium]